MLSEKVYPIHTSEREEWRKRILYFGSKFAHFSFLENGGEPYAPSWIADGWMAGIGCKQEFVDEGSFFDQLKNAYYLLPLFGYLGYDLKNQLEDLSSSNGDGVGAKAAVFFEPQHYLRFDGENLKIQSYKNADTLYKELLGFELEEGIPEIIHLNPRMTKEEYLNKVEEVIELIRDGEVYELNLCMEYFAEQIKLDPVFYYLRLMEHSEVPFASFLKIDSIYTLCASPERFLKKNGRKLLSQPIKGTRKRGEGLLEDAALKQELFHSEKDRAENVMIVDLVRNDLARSCEYGSIEVEELFGIYSFTNVHQMISTVSGTLREDTHFVDAIRYAFPMGSMTGAPKIRAMQLIEELEKTKRGIYSGSIGIFYPDGDFDLNVVIRSMLYNEKDSYLSVQAGGAITYDSKAEEEFEEIQLKLSNVYKMLASALIHKKRVN